jgi:hypothetical protein
MYYGMISNKLGYITHLRYLPTGKELQYMYLQYYLPVKTTIPVLTIPTYFGLRYFKKKLLGNTYGIIPTKFNNFTKNTQHKWFLEIKHLFKFPPPYLRYCG